MTEYHNQSQHVSKEGDAPADLYFDQTLKAKNVKNDDREQDNFNVTMATEKQPNKK